MSRHPADEFLCLAARSNIIQKRTSKIKILSGPPGATVNKALASGAEPPADFPILTFAPVDHSTIRNTCLLEIDRPGIQREPATQA
jgi:hypothetical protein